MACCKDLHVDRADASWSLNLLNSLAVHAATGLLCLCCAQEHP
jgi:hypothetical protein